MVSTPHPQSLVGQIVPRDLHTGDVVHNHYNSPPVELQDTSNIQTSSKLDPSTAQYFSYKEIGAGNWIFIGVVSGLCSAFIPTVSAVTGFFSLLGLLILVKNRDIAIQEPGHPDSERIETAFRVIVASVLCLPFGWLYGWSIFF